MTVFRKSVSWSKFYLALECPLRLQKTIEKEYSVKFSQRPRAAAMGKLVQKVFELYFNGGFNLKANGKRAEVLVKILDKVLPSSWAVEEGIDSTFREEAVAQIEQGFEIVAGQMVLDYQIRSEVAMQAVYAGFRMFGMIDFLVYLPKGILLWDGKGNAKEDADVRQLLYYGLMLHAAGEKVLGGGFLYWKHGYRPIDLSAKALYEFANGEFQVGRAVLAKLAEGVQKLEAHPSSGHCHFCLWRDTCEESFYKKDANKVLGGLESVGFGDLDEQS